MIEISILSEAEIADGVTRKRIVGSTLTIWPQGLRHFDLSGMRLVAI
jgi:hypothetical protein